MFQAKHSICIISLHPPKISERLKSYKAIHQSRKKSTTDTLLCIESKNKKEREDMEPLLQKF